MYKNWFSAVFMNNPDFIEFYALFKYYDVFTWRGFYNWWIDAITSVFAPWWSIYLIFRRVAQQDYTYQTSEADNNIDMNRLFIIEGDKDPYDFQYWTAKPDGQDCNGN
jgi:hypothetical protein